MSAHPTPHSSEDSGSFWSLANVILAVIVGGFALFWSVMLLYGAVGRSSGFIKDEVKAATPPAAAASAPVAAPSSAAPAPAGSAAATAAAAAPAAGAPTDVAELTLKPDVANPLGYNTKELKAKAGQKVKLTFSNTGAAVPQPHNVCIGKAGSKDRLLAAAMQMMTDPNGMTKGYIPDSPDLLAHSKLLQPGSSETIEFTAPPAGEYPYLCTFPGHSMLMNGVLKVE